MRTRLAVFLPLLVLTAVLNAEQIVLLVEGNSEEIPVIIDNAELSRKKASIYNPGHHKNKGKYAVQMSFKVDDSKWTAMEFFFSPLKTGTMNLSVFGGYSPEIGKIKGEQPWFLIKEIKLEEILPNNTTRSLLKNGDFKEMTNSSIPLHWTPIKTPYMITEGNFQGAAVNCASLLRQKFQVKAKSSLKLTITAKKIF